MSTRESTWRAPAASGTPAACQLQMRSALGGLLAAALVLLASPAAAQADPPLGIPEGREGSGTSWLPDDTPVEAIHVPAGPFHLMFHGNVFVQVIREGSDRGETQLGSIHWLMGMARAPVLGGELTLRAMFSLEALTVGRCGYPNLLASGEVCRGQPIVDRQHPHDLFMELALRYARAVYGPIGVEVYGGPAAEPALGPPAYPHRPSAMPNPVAPIGHHWLDSTHIAFGVVTAGVFGRRFKLEASVFNGREPDDRRFDFDFGPLDSYAGRLTVLPNDRWALQVSAGHLREAELVVDPVPARRDVTRVTASGVYHNRFAGRFFATTLAWGLNIEEDEPRTHALLLEASLSLPRPGDTLFTRVEAVEKTTHELDLPGPDRVFRVGKVSVGVLRELSPRWRLVPGLGGEALVSIIPRPLDAFYGNRVAAGFALFLRVRPAEAHHP
jgi:hypothetical protein